MNTGRAFNVKGWCPGALRPMMSGDGLLVRVKPWCGSFTTRQALGLADIAERFGNGHLDLTRRANLQIRGVRDESMDALHAALDELALLDSDAASEAARNVMVGPLARAETRALTASLTAAIAADHRLATLPAKFGWLLDDGGPLSIIGERADVSLHVMAEGVALRLRERWLGLVAHDQAVKVAIELALGEMPLLSAMAVTPAPGARHLGQIGGFFGLGVPFGRLEAGQLRTVASAPGASELRLSPWRALYVDAAVEDRADLIVDDNDPLLRIEACPGAPACRSSSVDTRRDARRLAARAFEGVIHVSGCAKGCARSTPADLTLVGQDGRYGVVHNGTTRDPVERIVEPKNL